MIAALIVAAVVPTASQPWVTNQVARAVEGLAAKEEFVVELESADWSRIDDDLLLSWNPIRDSWFCVRFLKGKQNCYELKYDDAWRYREWVQLLGGSAPDWQYTSTASRAAAELTFGNIQLVRTNETWTTNTYPVVRANVNLVIRETTAANGRKQYRLIRKEEP